MSKLPAVATARHTAAERQGEKDAPVAGLSLPLYQMLAVPVRNAAAVGRKATWMSQLVPTFRETLTRWLACAQSALVILFAVSEW